MRLLIAAVGRLRAGPHRDLYADYMGRLPWTAELREFEAATSRSAVERQRREAELLLGALPPDALLVALDPRGRQLTSEDLAKRIGQWRDGGIGTLAFAIGGADGLDDRVRQKAQLVLSFGSLTWPHMLVRVMLAEQLFRAASILSGHPYHRA